ncbi:branched-chain amino acid transport system permease protein [Rhodoligotrophos appendicifer]|uniref:branched-chain amino acid ABC transporter permease n=1 Tax=Rhodoligotrophos appendicifer TaxID=987056 RepID=UPI00147976BD|nr:branched-chain amino acid ABC transporter permease [Rhodoligotrophos appendicifer]
MLFVQLLVNGIFVGSVYALLGLSFATIFATTKIWHFAQGAVYTIGAYGLLLGTATLGLPFLVAVPIAMVVAAALGVASMLFLYRPLQRLGGTPLVMVMASLGVMIVCDNLLVLAFGPTGYSITVPVPEPMIIGGIFLTGGQLVAPIAAAIVVAAYLAFLFLSTSGRRLRALIDNEELLLLNGIDTARLKLVAFGAGSLLLPAAAALFIASGSGISPYIGIPAVLTGAMAMFFGGIDSIAGSALAGFLIGIIESLAAYILPTEWQTALTYAVVLLFLMVRPTGLFGRSLPRATL